MFLIYFVLSALISSPTAFEICVDPISNSSKSVTALILARGGSKGIKLKNIQKIDGVSLLGISLTALQETDRFESIWVSTDHEMIAEEASRCW
jgi:Cytidylyltransferase